MIPVDEFVSKLASWYHGPLTESTQQDLRLRLDGNKLGVVSNFSLNEFVGDSTLSKRLVEYNSTDTCMLHFLSYTQSTDYVS